jgi:hypothetical protein
MPSQESIRSRTLASVGIKAAESKLHEYGRAIAIVLLLGLITWKIYSETPVIGQMEEIDHIFKPDSILYNAVMELDPTIRTKYIKHMKATLTRTPESIFSRYCKNVGIALVAGICSEYIISGNPSKPIGGIAKTIVFATWNTSLS